MSRISRHEMLMGVAQLVAKRSTCLRLQCGAIIVRDGRILASGYNGVPAGFPHCRPETCGPSKPCDLTVHAEANAILFAARENGGTIDALMYCTDSPCMNCAKLIVNAGIKTVVYHRKYRDMTPIDFLHQAGVATTLYVP